MFFSKALFGSRWKSVHTLHHDIENKAENHKTWLMVAELCIDCIGLNTSKKSAVNRKNSNFILIAFLFSVQC